MKTIRVSLLAITGLAALLAMPVNAQLPDPLPATNAFASPVYASNVASYSAGLGSFYFSSDATVPSVISTWNDGPINLASILGYNPFDYEGFVKAIYIGETATWLNDFGYMSSAAPGVHTPLLTGIDSLTNAVSGYEVYVPHAAGESLDFFLNSGAAGSGGVYHAFGAVNDYSGSDLSLHTKWTVVPVETTYLDAYGNLVTGLVDTLIVGFEDARNTASYYDADFNDLVVAFQFVPPRSTPVPEPSTYGLIGAGALLGFVGYRRFKGAKAQLPVAAA